MNADAVATLLERIPHARSLRLAIERTAAVQLEAPGGSLLAELDVTDAFRPHPPERTPEEE